MLCVDQIQRWRNRRKCRNGCNLIIGVRDWFCNWKCVTTFNVECSFPGCVFLSVCFDLWQHPKSGQCRNVFGVHWVCTISKPMSVLCNALNSARLDYRAGFWFLLNNCVPGRCCALLWAAALTRASLPNQSTTVHQHGWVLNIVHKFLWISRISKWIWIRSHCRSENNRNFNVGGSRETHRRWCWEWKWLSKALCSSLHIRPCCARLWCCLKLFSSLLVSLDKFTRCLEGTEMRSVSYFRLSMAMVAFRMFDISEGSFEERVWVAGNFLALKLLLEVGPARTHTLAFGMFSRSQSLGRIWKHFVKLHRLQTRGCTEGPTHGTATLSKMYELVLSDTSVLISKILRLHNGTLGPGPHASGPHLRPGPSDVCVCVCLCVCVCVCVCVRACRCVLARVKGAGECNALCTVSPCVARALVQHRCVAYFLFDGRGSGHLGPAVGLKTLSIHVCVCPHFGM